MDLFPLLNVINYRRSAYSIYNASSTWLFERKNIRIIENLFSRHEFLFVLKEMKGTVNIDKVRKARNSKFVERFQRCMGCLFKT